MTMEFKNPPWHFGVQHAGTINNWLPSDTEDHYKQLIKDSAHRDYFEEQGWNQPGAITYKINSHGFRCDEFNTEPCMIALGCSFTLGTGLPLDDIWPTLVGQALGFKVYNLAWGGNGADTCFRLAEYWLPRLSPKLVCMLTPPEARIELLLDSVSWNKSEVFMAESQSVWFSPTDIYLKHWFVNDENARLNSLKNKLAIKELCNQQQIPFIAYDSMKEMSKRREEVGYARDYMHAGPIGHRMLADKIIRDYHVR